MSERILTFVDCKLLESSSKPSGTWGGATTFELNNDDNDKILTHLDAPNQTRHTFENSILDDRSPINPDFLLHDTFHPMVFAIVNIILHYSNFETSINPRMVSQTGEFVARVSEHYTRFYWFEWTEVDTATRKLFLPVISEHGNIFESVKKQIEQELGLGKSSGLRVIGDILRKFGLPNSWLLPVLASNTSKFFDKNSRLVIEHYFTQEFGIHIAKLISQGDRELQKNLEEWIKQIEIYPDIYKYYPE